MIEQKLSKAFCWIGLIARLNEMLPNRNFLSQVCTDSINQEDDIKEKKISAHFNGGLRPQCLCTFYTATIHYGHVWKFFDAFAAKSPQERKILNSQNHMTYCPKNMPFCRQINISTIFVTMTYCPKNMPFRRQINKSTIFVTAQPQEF